MSLIGERQKGHVYYRCHTRDCPITSLRETAIDAVFRNAAVRTNFSTDQWKIIESDIEAAFADTQRNTVQEKQTLLLAIAAIDDRMTRLTDAFVDQVIDKATYLERKERLLHERAAVEAKKDSANDDCFELTVRKNLELLKSLQRMPDLANDQDLRDLLKNATSNFSASGKSVDIKWEKPFDSYFLRGLTNMVDLIGSRLELNISQKPLFNMREAYYFLIISDAPASPMRILFQKNESKT